jgi:Spy/CpxP family protein refolding chaperone
LFAVSTTLASATSPASNVSTGQNYFKYLVVAEAHQHQEREGKGEGKGRGEGKGEGKRGQDRSGHGGHGDGGGKHGSSKMQGHGHGHGSYAHNVASQAEKLDLSDEQLGKIARLHMKDDKAHKHLKHNLQKSMKALRSAIMEPGSDDETIRKLGQAHVNEFNAMVKHHIQERNAVHDILTPDQVEKLKSMKAGHDHGH